VHAQISASKSKCLLGYFLGVLKITYRQAARTDFDKKYVKRRGSMQRCAFLGLQTKILNFIRHPFNPKLPF